MKISFRNPESTSGQFLKRALLCGFFASVALPAIAAPGDEAHPPRIIESSLIDQPAGTLFDYLFLAGSTFHPLESATTYTYSGSGCLAKTGGVSPLFAHKVILPEGVIVKYVRLYYYDTSASNVTAFFTTYDGAGNYNERSVVSSADGSSGYASALSPLFNFPVNQYTSAINLVVNLAGQNDTTLQFCGARIAYGPPITDRIFTNGFDFTPL